MTSNLPTLVQYETPVLLSDVKHRKAQKAKQADKSKNVGNDVNPQP